MPVEVDAKEISVTVYAELDGLEVEEVWDRAGRSHRNGYLDPREAAYQMMEEVLGPFVLELEKHQQLGMNALANPVCMGLLLGLHAFEDESSSEFKDWAPDAAGEWAGEIVSIWKNGRPRRSDIEEMKSFINQEIAGWSDLSICVACLGSHGALWYISGIDRIPG